MPAFRFLSIGVACLFVAAFARADNWERFRGPNGTGVSQDKNIPTTFSAKEGVLWKIPVAAGNSSPIVYGDKLFLHTTTDDGTQRAIVCYDTANGAELWKKTLPGKKVAIRHDSSMASSTPTTDGEHVFVSFWTGKEIILKAFNFKGDEVWSRNLGEFISQHGPGASPILYKDKVLLANDMDSHYDIKTLAKAVANPSTLYALDKKTGNTVWEARREPYRACYSAPFVIERPGKATELIITSTTAITSYDPDSGKPNWNWKWSFSSMPLRTVASTAFVNDTLLACSGDGGGDRHMVAVAMNGIGKDARPDQLWENKKDFPYVTCMLTRGDHVYFVNDAGLAGCCKVKTGEKVWFARLPDAKFYASPVMINGNIYACSDQGDVFVIAADPGSFQQIAKNALGERVRATPAVANGRLYIRGQNNLYCIGTK
jgi:outer membrane protein assembly factor BamB